MKKNAWIAALLLAALLCTGCGAPAETAAQPAPAAEPTPAEETTAPEPAAAQDPETNPEETAGSGVLVVYFSATGNTRIVAERIAALTGADLAEIVPAQPYTAEDLDYGDSDTRATVEQNTPDARPEIADEISLDGYTTVYLGYPIWWGQAPRILSSFVESHDFTGKTVIPFCTSGSSGAGTTGETLAGQAGTGTFLSATRLSLRISDEELQTWIDSLG